MYHRGYFCAVCTVVFMAIQNVVALRNLDWEKKNYFIDYLVIIPKHKLLFCQIPKSGSTTTQKILSEIAAMSGPPPIPTWRRFAPENFNMTNDDILAILNDSTWHKGIVYRDPAIRFLSGFLSKCIPGHKDAMQTTKHCHRAFGGFDIPLVTAIKVLERTQVVGDEHFRPQSDFCGNLRTTIQFYDTKLDLDSNDFRSKFLAFLKKADVDITTSNIAKQIDRYLPVESDKALRDPHATRSHDLLENFYQTKENLHAVQNYYKDDYSVFNMTPKSFHQYGH